jgi:hypothetical protein
MRGRFITRGYDDVTVDKAMAITVTVAVIQSLVDSPIQVIGHPHWGTSLKG